MKVLEFYHRDLRVKIYYQDQLETLRPDCIVYSMKIKDMIVFARGDHLMKISELCKSEYDNIVNHATALADEYRLGLR